MTQEGEPEFGLSIVIPLACDETHLRAVAGRLLETNAELFRRVPTELVLVDSRPNAGASVAVPALRKAAPVVVRYLETEAPAAVAKIEEGMRLAAGRFVLFLGDEALSMYDFLGDALRIVERGLVCSLPYLEAQVPEGGTHPLAYSRATPVMPATFLLAERDVYRRLFDGLPPYSMATWHWALAMWEMGVVPAFAARHVRHCPIVKMDSPKPSVYRPLPQSLAHAGRRHFFDTWTVERREAAHARMAEVCVRVAEERDPSLQVVRGPRGGVFLVYAAGRRPLPEGYGTLDSAGHVREECARSLERWKAEGLLEWDPGTPSSRGLRAAARRLGRRACRAAGTVPAEQRWEG